jgi:polyether ionophore transport system permease protein
VTTAEGSAQPTPVVPPAPVVRRPVPAPRPGRAVTLLAVRLIRRGALVVTALVAGLSALVAVQYRQTFAGALDSASLAALAANPAIRTLFGRPVALDDPGGFTVWRTGTFMAVLVGTWALLAATRITRGEEDAGRWEILLAGRLRPQAMVLRHLAVLTAAQVLVGAALVAAMLLAGTAAAGALRYGIAVALIGVGFAALGTLAAQLVPDRRAAAGLAVAVLGAGLLARMVADGADAVAWLHWVSPFGLLALVEPYAANRGGPLLILAGAAAGLVALVAVAARGRDLGAGRVPVRGSRRPRLGLLRSLPRFAARRSLRSLGGWALGLAAYFLLIGLLAASLVAFLADNPRYAQLAAQAGFAELGTVEGYAASLFALLAIPIGAFVAGRVGVDAADEVDRRLTMLFALPVTRTRWAAVEAGVLGLGCAILAVTAGLASLAGTSAAQAGIGLWPAVAGVLNILPVALLCLGAALFALGWVPSAVVGIGVLPAMGGFLLLVLADTFAWPGWIRALSPFAHLAAVPAVPPDWAGTAGMLAIAIVLGLAGAAGYARRDLRG